MDIPTTSVDRVIAILGEPAAREFLQLRHRAATMVRAARRVVGEPDDPLRAEPALRGPARIDDERAVRFDAKDHDRHVDPVAR
jgi:hypothetical protein